ncbi:stage VI sporulation protein D [Lentibacillus sp. Marseille-P4043]|uniref:stage VI sporulation protein D n=1 Tax=Lentibacillus sp. Marseille-P4043 TaxID=2040293 RepID=UPI001F21F2C9|nr:stage VI sporulation protein D [Lentibacillus sp. Marseille-P4043]
MSNDQAVFSFELNESLYFERGQEVSELMGISLDPEISIQAFHEYISIRGVIELQGEYVKADMDEQADSVDELDDYHARRFVERVVDTEDGETEFSHRFPVEISVPTYRVGDLDEVTVSIDSFDYELPDSNQLKFISTIAIHGISEQEESPRDENEETDYQLETDQTFEFDIKESQDLDMQTKSESVDYSNTPTLSDGLAETDSPDRWKNKKSQSFAEFFKKDPESEPDPPYVESSTADSYHASPDVNDYVDSQDLYESRESEESGIQLKSNQDQENQDSDESSNQLESDENRDNQDELEDVGYLSDMFRDDEEHFSRMRVCIVQENDTLETIADRYKLSAPQLAKQNRLANDTLSEGQLLYIPFKKNKE